MTSPPIPLPQAPAWLGSLAGRRIVVLGADGFIGSHATLLALAAGAEVTAACLKEPWRLAALASPRAASVRLPHGRWWEQACATVLEPSLLGADGLICLAYTPPARGLTDDGQLEHEREANVVGIHRIAQTAARAGVRVVFASSVDVYGPWHDEPVNEETPVAPATAYACAKLEAEAPILEAGGVVLRIATVFGAGENGPRAIPSFIRALLNGERPVVHGDGLDKRDFVHVVDVAAAAVRAAMAPDANGIFVIGSGAARTTLDVLAAVARAFGVAANAEVAPPRGPRVRLVVDPARARSVFGVEPRRDFERAVLEEARWLAEFVRDRRAPC